MTETEAESIANLSFHNRARVVRTVECGCFYCLAVFPGSEVQQWVDDGQTALCPRCGIDSVLANMTSADVLRELHNHRFETTVPAAEASPETALGQR